MPLKCPYATDMTLWGWKKERGWATAHIQEDTITLNWSNQAPRLDLVPKKKKKRKAKNGTNWGLLTKSH